MDDYELSKRTSRYNDSISRKSRNTRSAPTSVALEPIVVFGSNRVSTASSYKSAKSMTDSMKQSKKFPKLSTIISISHSQSASANPSQKQNVPNLHPTPPRAPLPLSTLLTPDKRIKTSLTSPSLSHRSYTPSSQYTSISKPAPPPPQLALPLQQQQQYQQPPYHPQYPFDPHQQYPPQYQQYHPQQPYYPPPGQSPYPLENQNYQQQHYYYQQQQQPIQPQQMPYLYQPSQQPLYYPPPLQNHSTIGVPQSEVPDKIVYREVQEEKPLSPRQYFIYRNGCALKIMKWFKKQKQIRLEKKTDGYSSQSYKDTPHANDERIIRQADQFLIDQQTRKNRSLLGELTKEIYEEDLNDALRNIIIETLHEEVSEYFSRHEVVYNKRISDPPIFDIEPERIEIRSLIREGILDRLISHGLLNKLSRDTNCEDNFYDLP